MIERAPAWVDNYTRIAGDAAETLWLTQPHRSHRRNRVSAEPRAVRFPGGPGRRDDAPVPAAGCAGGPAPHDRLPVGAHDLSPLVTGPLRNVDALGDPFSSWRAIRPTSSRSVLTVAPAHAPSGSAQSPSPSPPPAPTTPPLLATQHMVTTHPRDLACRVLRRSRPSGAPSAIESAARCGARPASSWSPIPAARVGYVRSAMVSCTAAVPGPDRRRRRRLAGVVPPAPATNGRGASVESALALGPAVPAETADLLTSGARHQQIGAVQSSGAIGARSPRARRSQHADYGRHSRPLRTQVGVCCSDHR
jgi:hypothetical protein